MRNASESVPVAYETPRQWLEGKRRLVDLLYRFCNIGQSRRNGPTAADREVLVAALNWHKDQHESRVAQTRAAGIRLPIDDFAAEFELDDVEREVVELLLVAATDLTDDDGLGGLAPAEVVGLLSCGQEDAAQEYLPYFLPGSRLRNVINCRNMLGSRRLGIDDELVAVLLGLECGQPERPVKAATEASWGGDIGEYLAGAGVVLGSASLDPLRAFWGSVRRRDVVREKWGFGSLCQSRTGDCLLLHGPSGTGKTMTARWLCRALGREPLVVSYPDLISKWVGDTEKNTETAFNEAALSGRALVFDEADAVFTRRVDVRSSSDRFANSQVNTLLMELERFPGVVILTTNHADVLDPALERRIRHKVYFGPPDAEARAGIWRKHLPATAPLAADVDLDRLAREFKLTGGQIANAALTAASLAASRMNGDSDAGEITMADFETAAGRELRGYVEAGRNSRLGF